MLWASLGNYWVKNTSCLLYLNLVLEKESEIWTPGRKYGQQEGPLQISIVLVLSFFKEAGPGRKKKEAKVVVSCCVTPGGIPPSPVGEIWHLTTQPSLPVEVLVKSHEHFLGHLFSVFSVSCLCTAANDTAVTGECELVPGKGTNPSSTPGLWSLLEIKLIKLQFLPAVIEVHWYPALVWLCRLVQVILH